MTLIAKAVEILRQGGVVAFPTETVYGLGARAFDEKAIEQIFVLKGRPRDNPLIVHIADKDQLRQLASEIPPFAEKLIAAFWPGPLTIVLERSERVSPLISAGLSTVAVRMPNHPMALELIHALGDPIAAPSANRSGHISPTSAQHVREEFDNLSCIIDGGSCVIGLESTVLDVTSNPPCILRPGSVTQEEIESVIGKVMAASKDENGIARAAGSPGLRHVHYAPRLKMVLVESDQLQTALYAGASSGKRLGVISLQQERRPLAYCRTMTDLTDYAKNLFSALHEAETAGVEWLFVETVPREGLGRAIMDRLERGARDRILGSSS